MIIEDDDGFLVIWKSYKLFESYTWSESAIFHLFEDDMLSDSYIIESSVPQCWYGEIFPRTDIVWESVISDIFREDVCMRVWYFWQKYYTKYSNYVSYSINLCLKINYLQRLLSRKHHEIQSIMDFSLTMLPLCYEKGSCTSRMVILSSKKKWMSG